MRNGFYLSKKCILDFVIAVFICIEPIRELLSTFTSHPATIIILIVYTLLLFYFLITGIHLKDIAALLTPIICVFILLVFTWILNPEKHSFYTTSLYNIWNLMFPTAGAYILGVSLLERDSNNYLRIFKISGWLMLILCFIQSLDVIRNGYWTRGSIYDGQVVTIQSNYNLNWGYNMFIACVIFTSLFILYKKKIYLAISFAALVEIFLYGSRGPLLMYVIFVALLYVFYAVRKQNKRGVIIGIVIISVALLLNLEVFKDLIIGSMSNLNIQSRTIEKLLNGSITDDSTRYMIYSIVISKFLERPIIGWGVFGDRYFLNSIIQGGSAYSHNIFLEMMVSFGIFGILFMVWIIVKFVKCIHHAENEEKRIILLTCLGGCLPLLLSLTFWNLPMFWFFLAVLINMGKVKRQPITRS